MLGLEGGQDTAPPADVVPSPYGAPATGEHPLPDWLRKLGNATGPTFDHMFLTMMIAHHTGAIEMAKTEQSKGKNTEAQALAKKIEAAQTDEIAQMEELLNR